MNRTFDRATLLSLFILYTVWGSTYLVMRFAVEGLPPMLMGGVRFLLAGTVLAVFLRARGTPLPTPRQWLNAAPVGVLLFVCGNGMVAIAEQKISSGVAAVVCGATPLLAAAFAPLFKEKTTPREWVGLAVGFAGVVILSLGSELRADLKASLLLMLAPIGWAFGSMLSRRLEMPKGLMSAAAQMLTGGAVMLAVGFARGEPVPTDPPLKAVLSWAYLVVFGSLVAFSAYNHLLRHTRPAVAMSYSYVNPAIAVLLGALLGSEQIELHTVLATALIIAATVVMVKAKGDAPAKPVAVEPPAEAVTGTR